MGTPFDFLFGGGGDQAATQTVQQLPAPMSGEQKALDDIYWGGVLGSNWKQKKDIQRQIDYIKQQIQARLGVQQGGGDNGGPGPSGQDIGEAMGDGDVGPMGPAPWGGGGDPGGGDDPGGGYGDLGGDPGGGDAAAKNFGARVRPASGLQALAALFGGGGGVGGTNPKAMAATAMTQNVPSGTMNFGGGMPPGPVAPPVSRNPMAALAALFQGRGG